MPRFDWTGTVAIPDDDPAGATVTFDLPAAAGLREVSLYLTHTYDADLLLTIEAPDATVLTLVSHKGTSADFGTGPADDERTRFRDNGGGTFINSSPPGARVFQPETLFGTLGPQDAGTWTVKAVDNNALDTGTFHAVSLFTTLVMPDLRNLSEEAAGAALRTAVIDHGLNPADIPVSAFPGRYTGLDGPYNDEDYLGTTGYADTLGADGTISYQNPANGELLTPSSNLDLDGLNLDVWGTWSEWTRLDTTLDLYGTAPEYRLFVAVDVPQPSRRSALVFDITTLHKPGVPAERVALINQYTDGEVHVPWQDSRTAKVTLSVYDQALGALAEFLDDDMDEIAYRFALRAWYRGRLVFWGPIVLPDWQGAARTVTFNAVDPSIHLDNAELVIGDDALMTKYRKRTATFVDSDGKHGDITIDYRGLRLLVAAARNTGAQTARGMPDIGIADGVNTAPTNARTMGVNRGDVILEKMKALVDHEDACEFALVPDDTLGDAYVRLDTFAPHGMGQDRTTGPGALALHYGFGVANLSDFRWTPGGKIITHQTAVDADKRIRVTKADVASSGDRGAYVKFESSSVSYRDGDAPAALAAWARAQVDAYGKPPNYINVPLRPEAGDYLDDFDQGDLVAIHAREGYMRASITGRIIEITLSQADDTGRALAAVGIVPDVGADDSDEDS